MRALERAVFVRVHGALGRPSETPPAPFGDSWRLRRHGEPRLELERLRVAFEPGKHWHDLMEPERVATEIVADAWGDLAADCDRALAELHERYLVRAARVLEAQRDLADRGSESWVAGGVIHHHAFQLAWDIPDEHTLLTEY